MTQQKARQLDDVHWLQILPHGPFFITCSFLCFNVESTAKFLETKQTSTTIPFGWDDADNVKTVRSIVVNSYNGVSEQLKVIFDLKLQ